MISVTELWGVGDLLRPTTKKSLKSIGSSRSLLILASMVALFVLGYHFEPSTKDNELKGRGLASTAMPRSSLPTEKPSKVKVSVQKKSIGFESGVTHLRFDPEELEKNVGLSWAAQRYREVAKVQFGTKAKMWTVAVKDHLSAGDRLVYVGGIGRVQLQATKVHFRNGSSREINALSGTFYSEDWQQWTVGSNEITKIEIIGRALTDAGTLRLFVQKL